jgi:hypothetical protein
MKGTTMPQTEAQDAIRRALHELQIQRGNGIFDLPTLKRILESGLVDA